MEGFLAAEGRESSLVVKRLETRDCQTRESRVETARGQTEQSGPGGAAETRV